METYTIQTNAEVNQVCEFKLEGANARYSGYSYIEMYKSAVCEIEKTLREHGIEFKATDNGELKFFAHQQQGVRFELDKEGKTLKVFSTKQTSVTKPN
jgi:hypothetical protein